MKETSATEVSSMPFIKNFFFVFVFILSFALIKQSDTELFGLGLFFAVNMLYCIFTSRSILNKLSEGPNEQKARGGILLIVMAFSFVSTILLAMTLSKIQNTFVKKNKIMRLGQNDSRDLDNAETIFITITVFMWVMSLYTLKTSDQIQNTLFSIGSTFLYSVEMHWIRILFSIAVIAVGSALYGQLSLESILVQTGPELWCNPSDESETNGVSMETFRIDFIKTYWLLFGFIAMKVLRPFAESNMLPLLQKNGWKYAEWDNFSNFKLNFKEPAFATNQRLLGTFPFPRWYNISVWGTWALGISALVYASYSIRDFQSLQVHDCMKDYAQIKQLFIAFIFFLICLYTVNVLTAYQFTMIITKIMKYAVPPSALALSSYLVYLTNKMSHLAAYQIIE